ncbi:hypothetical protein SYNPS1DRAFT_21564 [Syncephalis pseudoplumigaleata]|uniref:Uncharacterized protein n=1 Tax=Syncephalis pseudoplumigaleata TaxID=1712513 RepID=A0A4P9Z4G2_9FUNG|nr:hypothetical protein SYNPS1DRAFT_21564 [Syncephalis pseudoplumigaleata]|eukprot:RKP26731.1 hypothetical protein SYNPS1DRAFT_21564 [Syncephalis pseudoplumigaleata]
MKHQDSSEAVNVEALYALLSHLDDLSGGTATPPVTPRSPTAATGAGAAAAQPPPVHVAQLLRAYCAGTDVAGLPTTPASLAATIRRIGEQCRSQPAYHAMVDRVCEAYPTLRRIHTAFAVGGPKDAAHWPGFLRTLRLDANEVGHAEVERDMERYLNNTARVGDDCRFRVWRVVLEAGIIADMGVSRRQLDALHAALGGDDRVHYSTLHALRSAYERQLSWPDVMHAVGGLVRMMKPNVWEDVQGNGGGVANVLREMGTRVRNVYGDPVDTLTRTESTYDSTNMYEIDDDDEDIMELERNANSYEEMLDAMEQGDDDDDEENRHMAHAFYTDSEGERSFHHYQHGGDGGNDAHSQMHYYDPDEYMYGGSQGGSPMLDRSEPDAAMLTALGPPVVASDPYVARVNTPEEQALSVMMDELVLEESTTGAADTSMVEGSQRRSN